MIASASFLIMLTIGVYLLFRVLEIHFLLRERGDGDDGECVNVNRHAVRREPKVVTREAVIVLFAVFLSVRLQQMLMMHQRGAPLMHSLAEFINGKGGIPQFSGTGMADTTTHPKTSNAAGTGTGGYADGYYRYGRVPITRGELPMNAS